MNFKKIFRKRKTKKVADEKIPFPKLFAFADKKDVILMIIGAMGAVGNGLMMPMMTFLFGRLINAFSAVDKDVVVKQVSKVSLEFVYLAVAACIFSCLQVSCWMVTGERQATRIRNLYLKTILRQDISFFDKETTTGQVIGRMSGDTILIQDAMGEKVGKFIQLVSTFFGGFIIAFIKGWKLAVVMLVCLPLIVIAGGIVSVAISRLSTRGQKAYAEAGTVVEQTVGSIRTVVSFTSENDAIAKYNNLIHTAYAMTVKEGTVVGVGFGCVLMIIFGSYGLAIFYGSKLIIHNGYNGGIVLNVMMAIMTGGMSLGQASPCLNAFASGQAAAYKMFETIKRKPVIDVYDTSGIVLEDVKGDIELKDVYFTYPSRPDQVIFDGFSLFVPSGTTMALVGESGSGKSTVISMVERFYDPTSGEVLIDGINLKTLRLKAIREKIGLVSQEPVLFTTTIRENIAYGKDGATEAEINLATERANAANFISKMPSGLDTMVGEHGTQLSGGQKQRIAIARAILKNPKILLLDEATSALDAESEKIVQDALLKIMVNRTTIVVAHRLSTVKDADTISVVQRGKLIEQGSHSELIKDPDGAYSQLIRLQEVNKQNEATSSSAEPTHAKTLSHASSASGRNISVTTGITVTESESAKDQENIEAAHKSVSMKRLYFMNKPELPLLLVGTVAAVGNGVILPIFGTLLSKAIKIFYEPPHLLRKDSKYWALMFFLLGVASLVAITLQNFFFAMAGGKLIERVRSLCFQHVVHQEISWFDEPANSSGSIGARLSADASMVKSLVGDFLALIVQNSTTVITGFLIAMIANWKLAIIIIILLPLIGLQGYFQMKFMKGFSADAKKMYEEASQVANDAVGGIRTVASFCAEQRVMDTYEKKCEAPMKHGVKQGLVSGAGFGFSNLMMFGTYSFCFYIGALFVRRGTATFDQVFRVFFALTMAAIGVSQSSAMGPDANKGKDAAASIFSILDRESKIDASKEGGVTLPRVTGEIELQHVSFKYATRPDVQIFRDLCLTIPAGKTVALVGESGSGKSTVIALLERFYDHDTGKILIDGVEIQQFNLKWLRQQMGLVSQEPTLFSGTIRSNIAYGKKCDVSEDDIISAAKAANAHTFISGLPNGYDTDVGERGIQLSGGQKQRVAIARAILKDPRILLLDEATSALDAESERVVQKALDRVMVGRTSIVVAHRLSTVKGADIIAVVKNGVVAEKGTHDELMSIADGAYASLVSLHSSSK